MLTALVTRPAAQAAGWVDALRAHGIEARALPLIGIAAAADPAPVRAAWAALAQQDLVVFVSPNAVEQFFALAPAGAAWPAASLAGSPGPGTTSALRALGVPAQALVEPQADAAQFDSEALWAQLAQRDWHGRRVLIVRGDGGRDWLARTLRDAGARVEMLAAYRRVAPSLDQAQQALLGAALAAPREHVWLFSSSEAIDHLASLCAGGGAGSLRDAHAVATHPRIAERASAFGFGHVHASRAEVDAVVACIQSIRP